MPPKSYYSSISYTYTLPKDSGFIELSPKQFTSLYEPGVDIVEKLLEYSDYKDAKELIARIK
jgi:hypothetical protein